MSRCYSELIKISGFEKRFEYLKLDGAVGARTFGGDRYLNQIFYHDEEWRRVRRKILDRDNYCDLGDPEHELHSKMLIHHIEPIGKEDILSRSPKLFDPENLITVSYNTHKAIHYGTADLLPKPVVERKPNDTCPWR